MTRESALRQTLLELHYGLLDAADEKNWRKRIATEPDVARIWADVLQLADQLSDAAQLSTMSDCESTDTPPQIERAARLPETDSTAVSVADAEISERPARRSERAWSGLATFALVVIALASPVVLIRFGLNLPQAQPMPVRLLAEAVGADSTTQVNEFQFLTTQHDGGERPVTATLTVSVQTLQGQLLAQTLETNTEGKARFAIPADVKVPRYSRLNITATPQDTALLPATTTLPLRPTRCLTYLTTDKPLYRPGETVYCRSLTLERYALTSDFDVPVHFELVDPSGAIVANAVQEGVTDRGVGNAAFTLPVSAVGGQYKVVVRSLDAFFPEEERLIQVQKYRVPRFRKELEFRKRSYGPGDVVEADFSATRAEGGEWGNIRVQATAVVDGVEVARQQIALSESGTCLLSFQLPDHIAAGNGQLSIMIDDGGTRESMAKTIPIQLGQIHVDFYPEGGELAAGLENRVYFTARNTLDEPVHIAGEIQNRRGDCVATIETVRDGMGRFQLTPDAGEQYVLKITEPVDVTNSPALPRLREGLPVLDTGNGVFSSNDPLTFTIRTARDIRVTVQAASRGVQVASASVNLKTGSNGLSLKLPRKVGGVIRLTVLNAETTPARPILERLVYRRQNRQLRVKLVESEDERQRSPGEPVRLTVQVVDEHDHPTAAVLGVSVVDDAVLSLEEKERPTLRTHFLLTSEIAKPEDLEHADFYLDETDEAARSLDLLLGTQGWRRFVMGTTQPSSNFEEEIARLLELDGQTESPKRSDNVMEIQRRLQVRSQHMAAAWGQLLSDCRVVAIPILLAWLISIFLRPHRWGMGSTHFWLGVALCLSAGVVIGCGQNTPESTDVSASRQLAPPGLESDESTTMPFVPDASTEEAPANDTSEGSEAPATNPHQTNPSNAEKNMARLQVAPDDKTVFADTAFDDRRGNVREAKDRANGRQLTSHQLLTLLQSHGQDADGLAKQLLDELRFPVREYAHTHKRSAADVRDDFTETLYWQPLLLTDSQGRASIRFDLSDSVTSYRVLVDAHSTAGRIGSGGGEVTSRIPFQLEPKLPLEVTTGDRIDLPVAAINQTNDRLPVNVGITADSAFALIGDDAWSCKLKAGERQRHHFALTVKNGAAETDSVIEVSGSAGSLTDRVRRHLHVAPAGYPIRDSIAGVIEGATRCTIDVPHNIVPGSLAVTARAYPSPLADLLSGVDSILREPHGCFEQTSMSNYPNTMALQYLEESRLANPDVTRRARGFLDRGYQKLTSFECKQRGYEWFGNDPGHEALTAFGLMQFHDMAEVMKVDEVMVQRTSKWLMSRRDGNGGFQRNPRHLHVWSVQQDIVDAYVLWALTEAGGDRTKDLSTELAKVARVANTSRDPYLVALSAATLINAKRTNDGDALLKRLVAMQDDDGSLTGKTTVVQSGGLSLKVETTALAALAWLKRPQFTQPASLAMKWIITHRQGNGGFGSTQATVLALKALVAYSKHAVSGQTAGEFQVRRGVQTIAAAALPTDARTTTTIELTGLGQKLTAGRNDLELKTTNGVRLPYSIEVLYHVQAPPSDDRCPLRLTTRLVKNELKDDAKMITGERPTASTIETLPSLDVGDTVQLAASLVNTRPQGLPMSLAILGFPAGLEVRTEELNDMRDAGVFDYYELRPREVICYWRSIQPEERKEIHLTLTATIPGQYTGPSSRTYLYYTAEEKQWSPALGIVINR